MSKDEAIDYMRNAVLNTDMSVEDIIELTDKLSKVDLINACSVENYNKVLNKTNEDS